MSVRKRTVSRIGALLLALVMMLSLLPTSVLATGSSAEKTTYVLAGGDFQEGDYDANGDGTTTQHEASAQNVRDILAKIKENYSTMDGFLFTGDYDGDSHGENPQDIIDGMNTLMSTVQETYSNLNSDNSVLVQGNHDPAGTGFDSTGGQDFDGYSVYVINEDDYPGYGGSSSDIQTVANNMKNWLKARENSSAPIFVISHLPLAYSTRSYQNGDGKYAKYLFDVLNEAGAEGQNIFYLHGHNHAYGCDNPLGGEAIYLAKGDTINIANVGSQTAWTGYSLNFTYMNAGYVGYYNESGYSINERSADKLTMTVFAITGDEVTVERYSKNGRYQMKSAGRDGYYGSGPDASEIGLPINYTVYASPQTITLTHAAQTFTDDSTGISVTTRAGTGLTVSKLSDTTTYPNIEKYELYDISVTDFTAGSKATVSIPVPNGYDAALTRVYYVNNGALVNMSATVSGGMATFVTDHFSQYMLAQVEPAALDWEEVTVPGSTSYKYELDTDGINAGSKNKYIIVAESQALALHTSGSEASTAVPVSISSDGKTLTTDTRAYEYYWNSTYGFTRNGYNGLYQKDYNIYLGAKDKSYLNSVINNGDGTYCLYDNVGNQRGLFYKSSESKFTVTNTEQYNSVSVRLYKYTSTEKIDGEHYFLAKTGGDSFSFSTSRFANQTELESYLRSEITVYKADDANGTNQTAVNYTISGSVNPTVANSGTLTITYGTKSWPINVSFVSKTIKSVTASPMEGTVYVGATSGTATGSVITVTFDDNTTEEVPVTLAMVNGNYDSKKVGTYSGLTIPYGNQTITDYTLHVAVNPHLDPFPKSPNEGSVTLNKTATGIDFQNTGVAQVELSARGIPYERGVDVIIMLDTSSSMWRTSNTLGASRYTVFAPAFKALIDDLQAADGDIKVAIADFNGFNSYTNGSPATSYSRDETKDRLADNVYYTAENSGELYTGTNAGAVGTAANLNASAFVDVDTVNSDALYTKLTTEATYKSGTNYDYAFWATYQLGASIKAHNAANNQDRDLVVVFMTDGAPMQYNGYHSNGASYTWGYWLDGTSDGSATSYNEGDYLQALTHVFDSESGTLTTNGVTNTQATEHQYYFGGIGAYTQKHRWNEAVKGSSAQNYEVIDKLVNTAAGDN